MSQGDSPNDARTRVERPSAPRELGEHPPTDTTQIPPAEAGGEGQPRQPPAVGARFDERDELGRGGMGRVVCAYDRVLGREVAIKQVLDINEVAIARFEREAQITARLEHPGIVPIHDLARSEDGTPYYVMKRIAGERLDDRVAGRPFSERIATVPNILAACDACAFAHAKRVIHRDIKPSNILIGEFGETLLIDWGIAKVIDETPDAVEPVVRAPQLTRVGSIAGSPGFMAPEQARGERLDPRADVFALGATLFFVLAGQAPFDGESDTAMIDHVGAGGAADWSRLPAETPEDLRAIVEKALKPSLRDRYPDANALAADLRRYVSGQLVGVYDYGAWERLRRFIHRHRAIALVVCIALATLGVGAIFSVRRIVEERDAARVQRQAALEKADELRVQHALALATEEPAAAIAALRQLPADSKQWSKASVAATIAELHGIPIGFQVGGGLLAVSPTGHWIAVLDGVRLQLVDRETRRRHEITLSESAQRMMWIDETALLMGDDHRLVIVDPANGARRELTLPAPLRQLASDGTSTVWIQTVDTKVFAITSSTVVFPNAIGEGAMEIAAAGVGALGVRRTDRVELWRQGTTRVLRSAPADAIGGGAGRVIAQFGSQFCRYDIDAPAGENCSTVDTDVTPLTATRKAIWGVGASALVSYTNEGRAIRRPAGRLTQLGWNPGGPLYARGDTILFFPNEGGSVEQRLHRTEYQRLATSTDGRYLAALTTRGALLVWDLTWQRAKTYRDDEFKQLLDLGESQLVLQLGGFRVGFVDLATLRRTSVSDAGPWMQQISPERSWVVTSQPQDLFRSGGQFVDGTGAMVVTGMLRVSGGQQIAIDPAEKVSPTTDGLVSLRDGAISAIDHEGTRTPIARVDGATDVVAQGDTIAVEVGTTTLCRLTRSTGARVCRPLPAILDDLAVDPRGTIWIIAGSKLSRWTATSVGFEALLSTVSFHSFFNVGPELVAVGGQTLVALWREPLSLVRIPGSMVLISGTPDRLLAAENNVLSIIELETGLSYEWPFPYRPERGASLRGSTLAVAEESGVDLYELPVRRDPAALRRWLEQVTNAKPVEGSDVVEWP